MDGVVSYRKFVDSIDNTTNFQGEISFDFHAQLMPLRSECENLRIVAYDKEHKKARALMFDGYEADALWHVLIQPLLKKEE